RSNATASGISRRLTKAFVLRALTSSCAAPPSRETTLVQSSFTSDSSLISCWNHERFQHASLNLTPMGKTGCPLHPRPTRKKLREERVDHRYRRIHSGLPCAMVYGLLRALLGEPACLPPSPARCVKHRRQLGACVGAPGPHDLT